MLPFFFAGAVTAAGVKLGADLYDRYARDSVMNLVDSVGRAVKSAGCCVGEAMKSAGCCVGQAIKDQTVQSDGCCQSVESEVETQAHQE